MLVDPSAFVIPGIGDIGPYPRTYLRGPSFQNHDLALFKNIPFDGERRRYLQVRFELPPADLWLSSSISNFLRWCRPTNGRVMVGQT